MRNIFIKYIFVVWGIHKIYHFENFIKKHGGVCKELGPFEARIFIVKSGRLLMERRLYVKESHERLRRGKLMHGGKGQNSHWTL